MNVSMWSKLAGRRCLKSSVVKSHSQAASRTVRIVFLRLFVYSYKTVHPQAELVLLIELGKALHFRLDKR